MTLAEKSSVVKTESIGKSCIYHKNGKAYTYGENPYIDQFINSHCAQTLFPETFGPYDLSAVTIV